jgi:hypothetical protein
MTAPTTIDGAMMTDELIRKIAVQVYGTLATEQEMRFARALLSASKPAALDKLFELLMQQNIVTSEESYLALKCVGVPPTEEEFVRAVQQCIDACPAAPSADAQDERGALPAWFDAFLTNVCELPGRNGPDDEPNAIVATLEELKSCALNAIDATAPAQSGEPVAWRWKGIDDDWRYSVHKLDERAEPLYAAPQPAQTAQSAVVLDDERAALPRYAEWLHLRTHGEWSDGVPVWARDHNGRMNDLTAATAVIEELARAASPQATATQSAQTERAPMQPLVIDQVGTVRFKENAVVRYLLDNGGVDMNQLCTLDFSDEDRSQFAQLIGYSVSGYGELSYVSDESYERAADLVPAAAQPASGDKI